MYYLKNEHVKYANNKYIADKHKTKGLSDYTVHTRIKHLKTFYNFLVDEEHVTINPFLKVKLIKEDGCGRLFRVKRN